MQISRIRLSDKTSRRLSRATPSAASEHHLEFTGCPISISFATFCVCLELRSLPSAGVTRFPWYYEPLRHPRAPGLSLTGVQLVLSSLTRPRFGTSRVAPAFLGQRLSREGHANGGGWRRYSIRFWRPDAALLDVVLDELRTIRDQAVDSTQKYSAALIRLRRTAASAAFGLPFFVRLSPFTG